VPQLQRRHCTMYIRSMVYDLWSTVSFADETIAAAFFVILVFNLLAYACLSTSGFFIGRLTAGQWFYILADETIVGL